ncbi:unnamed protein product [Peronospora destructor]|uniref:Uncharacterized protein n=1 Tax=Peronospora destructor TaxID=86335 RepID=A0AAV0UXH2_9STRA|nr:unnamed protein product [Peronospora destructor]
MHVLHAEQEIGLSNASEIEEISCPRADIHSPTTAVRASSASNAEETLLQHSSIRIEDYQISDPSDQLYGEKHLESRTRFCGSSEPWSSRPPRQGSFSLRVQGSIGPSTPGGSAHVEEDKVEPNPLSASDEYFSKPIPSSLESVAFSSEPNQGAVSSLREQYAHYVLDGEDDIGELTGVGDHEEPHIERDHRRFDNSWSQNEGKRRSVENDDDQLKLMEGDILPDEWHLDEEPRHRRDSLDEVGDLVSGNLVDVADNNETATGNEPEVSEMDWRAKSKLQGHCPMRNDSEVEEDSKEKLSVETKLGGLPNDALTGLLNVRKEMTRLRAMTNNEESCGSKFVEKRSTPAQNVLDVADIAEEAQEQFPLKQDTQPKTAGHYMERLTHADRLSRSSLVVPSNDIACEQPKESSYLKIPEQDIYDATTKVDSYERSEESNYLGLQASHSPPRVRDHSNARIDEPGLLDFAEKDRGERTEAPSLNLQQDAHYRFQASFDAHEQAGRFDDAEKLFATKDDPSALGIYNRPQSPEPERYMHSKPYHVRFPPTQLGAKLNPSVAKAGNKTVVEEKIDAAPKDVVTEDVTAVANAEMEATPAEGHKEVSQKDRQPVTGHDETNKIPAPDCAKRDTSPLTPDTAPRFTSKPSAVAQGRKTPPAILGWASSFAITIVVFLAAMFCLMGILRAAKKVQDSHEYHLALKTRIEKFEASITETHKKVLKLEDDYAIWSEYVRKLTEEDEVHALAQLEAIQVEVQKWQREMNADLVAFQQSLSVNSIEASLADLHVNNTKQL